MSEKEIQSNRNFSVKGKCFYSEVWEDKRFRQNCFIHHRVEKNNKVNCLHEKNFVDRPNMHFNLCKENLSKKKPGVYKTILDCE